MTNLAPFNLEKALAGEPVRLRNGQKAYILKQFPKAKSPGEGHYPLFGYIVKDDETFSDASTWALDGHWATGCGDYNEDIIGMYKEEFETILPKPVSKIFAGNTYYYPNMNKNKVSIRTPSNDSDLDPEKDPILFETEAEAQQVLDVLRENFKK